MRTLMIVVVAGVLAMWIATAIPWPWGLLLCVPIGFAVGYVLSRVAR